LVQISHTIPNELQQAHQYKALAHYIGAIMASPVLPPAKTPYDSLGYV
jgi:hypothetical protein